MLLCWELQLFLDNYSGNLGLDTPIPPSGKCRTKFQAMRRPHMFTRINSQKYTLRQQRNQQGSKVLRTSLPEQRVPVVRHVISFIRRYTTLVRVCKRCVGGWVVGKWLVVGGYVSWPHMIRVQGGSLLCPLTR